MWCPVSSWISHISCTCATDVLHIRTAYPRIVTHTGGVLVDIAPVLVYWTCFTSTVHSPPLLLTSAHFVLMAFFGCLFSCRYVKLLCPLSLSLSLSAPSSQCHVVIWSFTFSFLFHTLLALHCASMHTHIPTHFPCMCSQRARRLHT